ncbi:MAG: SulP family inorganic anion transporter [Gammaproteobacteria bacterium]|nr:SulP family inorganic anion transporter [Gammaproteobacteria bacterium]
MGESRFSKLARMRGATAGLGSKVLSKKTLLAVTVGLVSGAAVVVGEISLAGLIFSGPLAPYSSEGVGLVLFGCFAACLVLALMSGFRGAVSAPPVPTLIVLAVIGGSLAAEGDALFATMVAIIVLCAVATGACTWLIGHFRLANMIRFIPYPVSSGFVAGTGGVACLVGLSMMGVKLDVQTWDTLLEPLVVANWGIGIAYGVGVYLAAKRWNSFLLLPVSFPLAAAFCHLGLAALAIPTDDAAAAGLLFGGISEGRLWPGFGLGELILVDWAAVAGQIPNMLTLVIVTLLCVVMYVGGLEVAANRELDWNHEFRSVGVAGVVAGVGGGPPGCMIVPTSMRSLMFGADMRFTGVVAALVIGATLLVGDIVLKAVPVPLMGGVLLFTGMVMLDDWLVKVRKRVPIADYLIVVVMFLTITVFGFFEGVGVGMLITIVFFVVRISRIDLVDSRYTARERRSTRRRTIPDRAILKARGDLVHAYRLAGYVFFGSGYRLVDRLRKSLAGEPSPRCVLLDFDAVSGLDFSSVNALCRFVGAARDTDTRVVICAAPERLDSELRRNLPPPLFDDVMFEPDADAGLARCEDIVIEDYRVDGEAGGYLLETVAEEMGRHLDRQAQFEELLDELGDWITIEPHDSGASIVAAGEPFAGVGLVATGSVWVYGAAGDRLAQRGTGAVIEPHSLVGSRLAQNATVADDACRIARLTPDALRLLEADDGMLAIKLYRYLLSADEEVVAGPGATNNEGQR